MELLSEMVAIQKLHSIFKPLFFYWGVVALGLPTWF